MLEQIRVFSWWCKSPSQSGNMHTLVVVVARMRNSVPWKAFERSSINVENIYVCQMEWRVSCLWPWWYNVPSSGVSCGCCHFKVAGWGVGTWRLTNAVLEFQMNSLANSQRMVRECLYLYFRSYHSRFPLRYACFDAVLRLLVDWRRITGRCWNYLWKNYECLEWSCWFTYISAAGTDVLTFFP